MVEVLVAICLLAIGVIGAAGMQLAAMRTMQQSAYHTMALLVGADIADALQAAATRAPATSDLLGSLDYRSSRGAEPPAPASLCYYQACSEGEFAEFEIYEWKQRIAAALPDGRIRICRGDAWTGQPGTPLSWDCAGSAGSPFVIKLGWLGKNPDGRLLKNADGTFAPSVALLVAG